MHICSQWCLPSAHRSTTAQVSKYKYFVTVLFVWQLFCLTADIFTLIYKLLREEKMLIKNLDIWPLTSTLQIHFVTTWSTNVLFIIVKKYYFLLQYISEPEPSDFFYLSNKCQYFCHLCAGYSHIPLPKTWLSWSSQSRAETVATSHLPAQVFPSGFNVYPGRQRQWKEPGELSQMCSQPCSDSRQRSAPFRTGKLLLTHWRVFVLKCQWVSQSRRMLNLFSTFDPVGRSGTAARNHSLI